MSRSTMSKPAVGVAGDDDVVAAGFAGAPTRYGPTNPVAPVTSALTSAPAARIACSVRLDAAVDAAAPRELGGAPRPRVAELGGARGVVEDRRDRARERAGIIRVDDRGRVAHDFGERGSGAGDERCAAGERLERRQPEALLERRIRDHVGPAQQRDERRRRRDNRAARCASRLRCSRSRRARQSRPTRRRPRRRAGRRAGSARRA